ncbi:MAG: hypothetical protein ACK5L3_11465, partial [Oscillospiraceae bacterium]
GKQNGGSAPKDFATLPMINKYNTATLNEAGITNDIEEIAGRTNGSLQGLEFRLKSMDSFSRKVWSASQKGNAAEAKTLAGVHDLIRYTITTNPNQYVDDYSAAIELLKDKGYTLVRVKNSWGIENTSYWGVNTILEAPNQQAFELQFHTPESFNLKNGTLHTLYEEARLLSPGTARYQEINAQMIELTKQLEVPLGIEAIK